MPAVIIATVAAINANIAAKNAARANQQHIARCSAELASYKPEKVSVQEMQSYAECVKFIYPENNHNDDTYAKIAVAALLISMLIGGIIGFCKSDYDKVGSTILGAIGGIGVAFIAGLITFAVMFVFS